MSEPVPDSVLLASVDVARAALYEITDASTVGEPVGHVVEDEHVVSLLFECTLPGYPGWNWTVTLTRVDDGSEPSVLEAELMPGSRALLAPEWVPWSERLAEYQAQQEAARAEAAEAAAGDEAAATDDDATDDDEFDDDELDIDDELDDDLETLHGGDIDGVDIDIDIDDDDDDGSR